MGTPLWRNDVEIHLLRGLLLFCLGYFFRPLLRSIWLCCRYETARTLFYKIIIRRKNVWYATWIPVNGQSDEWIPQLLQIKINWLKPGEICIITNEYKKLHPYNITDSFQWVGDGRLICKGSIIVGDWTSTKKTETGNRMSGVFIIEYKAEHDNFVGVMTKDTSKYLADYKPFFIVSKIDDLPAIMSSYASTNKNIIINDSIISVIMSNLKNQN